MVDEVLDLLDHMSKRPAAYVRRLGVDTIESYLNGLISGLVLSGFNIPEGAFEAAAKSRGWERRATGIVWHMREKKLTDEQIIQELIAVAAEEIRLSGARSQ
jgi:hypothetical protein